MQVLKDEREAPLPGVMLAGRRLGYCARGRVPEEGSIISEAIVIASQAEAERENQDVEGRGDVPAAYVPVYRQVRRI
jgi:hypothetical protein